MSSEIILLGRDSMVPTNPDTGKALVIAYKVIIGFLVLLILVLAGFNTPELMTFWHNHPLTLAQLWQLGIPLLFALLLARVIYKRQH